MKIDILKYIYDKTYLSPREKNEYYSPIFSDDNNKIVGNYFKYNNDLDFTKISNNLKSFDKKTLSNIMQNIYLYDNENSINSKLKSFDYKGEDLYLIRKNVFLDIKKDNNYEKVKNLLKEKMNKIPTNLKEIYQIIKSISTKDFKYFNNNNINKDNIKKDDFLDYGLEIETESIINPNNKEESYMIYKDFELIDVNAKNFLINDKVKYDILKCSFLGKNEIIIHYPINKLENKNYICILSKFDEEKNDILNKYLLIYKKENDYKSHFKSINYNMKKYLKNLSFVNNTAPIVIGEFYEIGTVIKLINNKGYFPPIPLEIIDIKQDFNSKPLIGLENIGATCYMNATLQCLCNIQKFVDYFKYNNHLSEIVKDDINKEKLCSAFKLLIENLYNYKSSQNYRIYLSKNQEDKIKLKADNSKIKSYYAPRNFKDTISRMNPLFKGIAANDAKDLVNFLLMTLHEELNMAPQNQTDNNNDNFFQDQTNKSLMLNNL